MQVFCLRKGAQGRCGCQGLEVGLQQFKELGLVIKTSVNEVKVEVLILT